MNVTSISNESDDRHVHRLVAAGPPRRTCIRGPVAGPGCDDERVSDAAPVTDNQAASRFEIAEDGHTAELRYHRHGNRLALIHTEVPGELEGRGIGGRLVAAAVDRAASAGLTIVPYCPFARRWLERHSDVADRVPIDWQAV